MTRTFLRSILVASLCVVACAGTVAQAQTAALPEAALGGLHWRDVGPMRGGRSFAVAGNVSQPNTFYFGAVGGGVWKTENAGRTWYPISDQGIPIGSIGAIAVAPSNPNVVYVGTGEPDIRSQHSYGIGMYKSVDAGWRAANILAASWWILLTRIACMWRCWGTCMTRILSVACIARPTAGRTGRRCCSTRLIPMMWERLISRWTRRIRG
jgi:hypothetical protein